MSQIDALRQAVKLSPDNLPLLLLFAETCLEEFHADEAVATFQQILAREPDHRKARLGLARALHQTGKTSEAVVRLESLVQNHPDEGLIEEWLLNVTLPTAEAITSEETDVGHTDNTLILHTYLYEENVFGS